MDAKARHPKGSHSGTSAPRRPRARRSSPSTIQMSSRATGLGRSVCVVGRELEGRYLSHHVRPTGTAHRSCLQNASIIAGDQMKPLKHLSPCLTHTPEAHSWKLPSIVSTTGALKTRSENALSRSYPYGPTSLHQMNHFPRLKTES